VEISSYFIYFSRRFPVLTTFVIVITFGEQLLIYLLKLISKLGKMLLSGSKIVDGLKTIPLHPKLLIELLLNWI
jgi:hypothetical protein